MNRKIFILTATGTHFWHSINVIEEVTRKFLSDLPDLRWIGESEIHLVAEGSLVYFLSDKIILEDAIQQLKHISNLTYLIPVYGNMTIETNRWSKLHTILSGEKVIFLCASHRSCKQVSLLVKGGTIVKLPYPIDEVHFSKPLPNSDAEVQLVYAGRLTPQKNILPLMKLVQLVQKDEPNLRLHVAGEFHDRGYHFHGLRFDMEEYKEEFYKIVDESAGKIVYHGFLSQEELLKLHQKSDYVISMSTYHDEDFGVSIAQGLAQGLVPILTDWGGHPDFLKIIDGIKIPVKLDALDVPNFQVNQLYMELLKLSQTSLKTKSANQGKFDKEFGKEAFLKRINEIFSLEPSVYEGQSELYMNFVLCAKEYYPFSQGHGFTSVKYLDYYQSYLKD